MRMLVCLAMMAPLFFVLSCETADEKQDLEQLTRETEKPFPKTEKQSQELQREVDELNVEIKKESEKQIEQLQQRLRNE